MEKKKKYAAPKIKRVRLDVKSAVMGNCMQSPDNIVFPVCYTPGITCSEPAY